MGGQQGAGGGTQPRPMPSQMPRMLGAPGQTPVAGMPQQMAGIGAAPGLTPEMRARLQQMQGTVGPYGYQGTMPPGGSMPTPGGGVTPQQQIQQLLARGVPMATIQARMGGGAGGGMPAPAPMAPQYQPNPLYQPPPTQQPSQPGAQQLMNNPQLMQLLQRVQGGGTQPPPGFNPATGISGMGANAPVDPTRRMNPNYDFGFM